MEVSSREERREERTILQKNEQTDLSRSHFNLVNICSWCTVENLFSSQSASLRENALNGPCKDPPSGYENLLLLTGTQPRKNGHLLFQRIFGQIDALQSAANSRNALPPDSLEDKNLFSFSDLFPLKHTATHLKFDIFLIFQFCQLLSREELKSLAKAELRFFFRTTTRSDWWLKYDSAALVGCLSLDPHLPHRLPWSFALIELI